MSILGRHVSGKLVAFAIAVLSVGALLSAMSGERPREIVLVAKGMAFYLESDPATPNPTLRVAAGERVRIVFRNEDRGMRHDFAVPALGAALDLIGTGQTAGVTLDVPATAGTYEYFCRPHQLMMHGTIEVR
jgi:plastocyanin